MEDIHSLDKLSAGDELSTNPVEESSVTMLDVLEEEKELEEEYAAVLGASDEKSCTYVLGSIKRQALYSCLTCCPEGRHNLQKCAGICLACSYQCHENHELVELYTKRNFRCDCPTERTGGNPCTLNASLQQPQKENNNIYNQNFQGLYCTCHRPYPDPEQPSDELMLQCVICEDWFHLHHMNAPANAEKLVEVCSEMICGSCMDQHKNLHRYTGLALRKVESCEETADGNLSVVGHADTVCEDNDDHKLKIDLDKSILEIMNMSEKNALENEPSAKRQRLEEAGIEEQQNCRKPIQKGDYVKGPTFWGSDWRMALCGCSSCMSVYEAESIKYLLDPEDSAKSYEERGIKKHENESTYEQGIRALASIDRVQQIDVITEYNRMKSKLKEYLQTFVTNKKVVTEEDINQFFSEMRNEKNVEIGLPYMCR